MPTRQPENVSKKYKAADMPSLSALSAEHLDAVEYARKVYLDAGGDLSDVLERLSLPFLLRFLIGNNWDPKKTAAMLKSTAEWRKKKGTPSTPAPSRQRLPHS
jgi:hypothetical protein